jgi:16S rRNA (cytosine967-C5)-methyltransferase
MKSPRHIALEILICVETKGRHPDDLLDDAFKRYRSFTDLDRAFVTELVYGTLRWQGKIDWVISRFSRVKIERVILHILRLGMYQLLFLTKTPHRAAVNECVILAKKLRHPEAAGFVNALLRRTVREGLGAGLPAPEGTPQEVAAVEQAFPLWAVSKLWDAWGEDETRAFCRASNQKAQLTLRVNSLKTDRRNLSEQLAREGLQVSPTVFSPDGLVVREPPPVSKMPLLGSEYYLIQDEAAQLVTVLLDPKPDERVLDACAAPGTKTTHVAQRMENRGEIWAVDIDGKRLSRVRAMCRRMGITNVRTQRRDVTQSLSLSEGEPFDAILLDVPCTGWGTIRRNPDIKWRIGQADIHRLASLQKRILECMSDLLRKGGRIVYSTCTVFEEENDRLLEAFLTEREDFVVDTWGPAFPDKALSTDKGFLRTLPHRHDMDGFFAVRLRRR